MKAALPVAGAANWQFQLTTSNPKLGSLTEMKKSPAEAGRS
jgi:hypothetical protein